MYCSMYPNAAIFDAKRPKTRVPFSPSGSNWLNRYESANWSHANKPERNAA